MRIPIRLLLALTLCAPAARADEEPARGPAVPDDIELVPSIVEQLQGFWSGEVKGDDADWTQYGRLRDVDERQTLSLSDCVMLALENNTELKIERLAPASARQEVLSSLSVFDPSFTADVGKDRAVTPTDTIFSGASISNLEQSFRTNLALRKVLRTGGQAELSWVNTRNRSNLTIQALDPDYRTELRLSLNQPLLRNFGTRFNTILVKVAEVGELQAIRNYEARVADIVLQVEQAYWELVRAEEGIRVQERGLEASRELLRQNEGKYEVGTLPRTSVLEAQSEVASREAFLVQAENRARIARDQLRALLNVSRPDGASLISIDPAPVPEVDPELVVLDESLDRARRERPELEVAQLELRARALALKAAENQLLPRLNAVGAIGTNGLSGDQLPVPTPDPSNPDNPFAAAGPSPFSGGYEDAVELLADGRFYSYSLGVVLEIPIGNAASKADYRSARIDLERARLQLRQLQQNVTLEVKTAINNLESDLRSIEANRLARELAEENVRNQEARYDVGLATTKDLLDFRRQLTAAQAAEIEAITRYHADRAALNRAEGTLLAARNIVIDIEPKEQEPWWSRF